METKTPFDPALSMSRFAAAVTAGRSIYQPEHDQAMSDIRQLEHERGAWIRERESGSARP